MTNIPEEKSSQEKTYDTDQKQDVEMVNGVACPIDPQARLECESCQ